MRIRVTYVCVSVSLCALVCLLFLIPVLLMLPVNACNCRSRSVVCRVARVRERAEM